MFSYIIALKLCTPLFNHHSSLYWSYIILEY